MYHTDTSTMRDEAARLKAVETKRRRMIANSQITQAIELLIDFSGYEVPSVDTKRVAELEAENEQLKRMVTAKDRALVEAQAKVEEAEAKLALIRETMGL